MNVCMCSNTHTYAHTQRHTHTNIYTHTHMHSKTHTHTNKHTHTHTHTERHTHKHIHTHIHTCTERHTHTYTHIHTPLGGRGPSNNGVPQGPPGQPRLPTTGAPPPMPVPKEDFDFTAALEKFNKEEIGKVCMFMCVIERVSVLSMRGGGVLGVDACGWVGACVRACVRACVCVCVCV